jgi:NAD(P)-dependent dehydrogenase (short-subunit alcohol dehydrogenase family)
MSKGITPVDPNSFFANRFKNQVLFVTGAAHSSIGGATAIRAAREGAKVFCVDIKADKLNQTVQEIKAQGGQAIALVTDLCEAKAADHAVAECVAQFGGLNLVLNAAGVMDGNDPSRPPDFENTTHLLPAAIHTATDEYWHNVMNSNIIGLPGNPAYSASKHAVTGLTRNAAIDYAPFGIRVNSVNMAQTDTPMVFRAMEFVKWAIDKGMGSGMASFKSASLLSAHEPDKRGATPWEQAAVILFLLSADASNITGACYATDGGWTTY